MLKSGIITSAINRFQYDAQRKMPDNTKREEGDAAASAPVDDIAGALSIRPLEVFNCRSKNPENGREGQMQWH